MPGFLYSWKWQVSPPHHQVKPPLKFHKIKDLFFFHAKNLQFFRQFGNVKVKRRESRQDLVSFMSNSLFPSPSKCDFLKPPLTHNPKYELLCGTSSVYVGHLVYVVGTFDLHKVLPPKKMGGKFWGDWGTC